MQTDERAHGATPPKRRRWLWRIVWFLGFLGFLLLGGLVYILSQVEVTVGDPGPPPRPKGVPANAIWYGGLDGGRFYLMSPAQADGTYRLKVYNDWSGELESNVELRLDQPSSAPIRVRDQKTFEGWDGNELRLSDGHTLSRVRKQKTPPK